MKLTEEQIWKCNDVGDGGVHICFDHQDVVGFARSIEREIGFDKAELWIKRINEAVLAERKACAEAAADAVAFNGGPVQAEAHVRQIILARSEK